MQQGRRSFLKSSFAVGSLSMLPFRFSIPGVDAEALAAAGDAASPIRLIGSGEISSREFNGDDVERTHEILWNVEAYMRSHGGYPQPTEEAPVVVIGGGVAGLYTTYLLRDLKPVILEQERSFGGNSKGEQLGGSRYSLGAAYVVTPEKGSPNAQLFTELDLWRQGRQETGGESGVFFKNRFVKGFWQGVTDPSARADFMRVYQSLEKINAQIGDLNDDAIAKLDSVSFASWMRTSWNNVHPHVHEYFQLYAWSSFTASLEELSAYQMLGFIAAETGNLMAFPGGNAAITQRLYERLGAQIGRDRMRAGCIVVEVRMQGQSVLVTYVDAKGEPRAIRTGAVVFAAPKFVARRVVTDLPPAQERAMSAISYRGYLVGNIFLDRPFEAPTFDMYWLEGEVPPAPKAMRPSPRPFTDICFGSWAQRNKIKVPVLTVYKAFAFDGDRQFLFNPTTHDKYRARFVEGVRPLLASMGLSEKNILGVRMTRWGHSLPVAGVGMIASGKTKLASQPVGGRIFFANQDNQVNPSFEAAAEEALIASKEVRRVLAQARSGFTRR